MKQLLKIFVTILLIGWLVHLTDWRAVWDMLLTLSWPLVGLYVLLQLVGSLLSSLKWRFLARQAGFSFTPVAGFFAYLSGAFINNFLPSTIGGDTYRTLWMSRTGERSEAALVVLYDRLTGVATLFILSLGFFVALPLGVLLDRPWLIMLGAVLFSLAFAVVLGVFLAPRFLATILFLLRAVGGSRVAEMIGRLAPFTERHVYLQTLLWSLAFFVVGVGFSNYVLFQALGAEIGMLSFLGTIFLATLAANIPISVNNIGVKEWSYTLFFGFFGVSLEFAVTAALLSRVLQMFISCIALPWYWRSRKDESHFSIRSNSAEGIVTER